MPAKRLRICLFCHQVGITADFPNGNQLRQHIKVRHPRTNADVQQVKKTLREYRRTILLTQERLRRGRST